MKTRSYNLDEPYLFDWDTTFGLITITKHLSKPKTIYGNRNNGCKVKATL